MPDELLVEPEYEFYEPRWFRESPTYRTWVKLFIGDCFKLRCIEGFEGTRARFWKNHPIRWIQLVGIVVSITIKTTFAEVEIDDGSGQCIALYLKAGVADSIRIDFEHNDCSLSVCDLVKVKGSLATDHRSLLQFVVDKIEVLTDPGLEFDAWTERIRYKKDVLNVPWQCNRHMDAEVTEQSHPESLTTTSRVTSKDRSASISKERFSGTRELQQASDLDLTTVDARQHTQRNLKIVLLQYFKKNNTREFSINTLRATKSIEQAVICVALRSLCSQQATVGMQIKDNSDRKVTSAQKYRTINACLADLVRDGSLISLDATRGTFAVVGLWNLGVLILDIMARMSGSDIKPVTVRGIWQAVRQADQGFESVSKHMVHKILEELQNDS